VEYKLDVQGTRVALAAEADRDGQSLELHLDGEACTASYSAVPPHRLRLTLLDGRGERSLTAFVAEDPEGGKTVVIHGVPYRVRDADAPQKRPGRGGGPGGGPRLVTPPMPSVVTKLLVAAGDRVCAGQGVIVVSAMKMGTTLTARHDGVVTGIHAAVNDKVAPGQVLIDIEASEEEAG